MMPRNHELGTASKAGAPLGRDLGTLNFNIDRACAVFNRDIENFQLILDAAVKSAMVLMPPAGGEDRAIRVTTQKLADHPSAGSRVGQIVETKLEEILSRFSFAGCLFEKTGNI